MISLIAANSKDGVNLKDALFGSHPITTGDPELLEKPTSLLSKILPNIYIAAGLILFFLLLFGGFTLISSGGDPEKTQQGQKTITNAIIGFLIIFASYWIIQIIQILTGVPILTGL